MIEQPRYSVTINEFQQFLRQPENQDRRFELIHGEIVERVEMTQQRGLILGKIAAEVYQFLNQNPFGLAAISVDYCVSGDDTNFRTIDLSFVTPTQPLVTEGCVVGMPDLAIEIKTLDMTVEAIRERAQFYLDNGSRLVWLTYPDKQIIEVYKSSDELWILTEQDMLSGGEVLPGFSLAVKDIFNYS